MRENCTYGSEGGEARCFPYPYPFFRAVMPHALGVILEAGPTVRKNGVSASTRRTLAAREVTYANARLPRVIGYTYLLARRRQVARLLIRTSLRRAKAGAGRSGLMGAGVLRAAGGGGGRAAGAFWRHRRRFIDQRGRGRWRRAAEVVEVARQLGAAAAAAALLRMALAIVARPDANRLATASPCIVRAHGDSFDNRSYRPTLSMRAGAHAGYRRAEYTAVGEKLARYAARTKKNPYDRSQGFFSYLFWLPDLDSNQGPAD